MPHQPVVACTSRLPGRLPRFVAGLAAALVAACGADTPPAPTVPADAAPPPTDASHDPERELALQSPLHRAHLESLEPIQCIDCHRIVGPQAGTDVVHRCLGCHPDHWSAVHALAADEDARDCTSCHEFVLDQGEEPTYWACADCHLEGEAAGPRAAPHPEAPKVLIHDDEWCGNCHVPHGEEPLHPRNCTDCHDDLAAVNHRRQPLPGAEACQECHGGHQPASAALDACASCHAEDIRLTATFDGHDQCITCHTPHDKRRGGVTPCTSCHQGVVTLAARTAPEHANCRSCHDEHAVQTAAQSCERCHADVRSTHPPEQGLGMCLGCHPPHPEPGAKRLKEVTRVGCFRCHDDAPTETAHHGAKTTCADCHTPHQFALTAAAKNPDFCLGCHGGGVGARRPGERVRPAKGHDNCAACHTTAAHRPEAPRPACGSCHAPQEQTITKGHETCTECHPAHEARVPANVTCERCHQTQLRARHGQVDGGCETCHRPHGPEGVVKPPACASCHDTGRLFGLHRLADHATCNDCHASHDQGATGQRAACTTACHQTMTTHEPQATTCVGCHLFDQPRGAK